MLGRMLERGGRVLAAVIDDGDGNRWTFCVSTIVLSIGKGKSAVFRSW